MGVEAEEHDIYEKPDTIQHRIWRRTRLAEDNQHAGLVIIEAWFGGY